MGSVEDNYSNNLRIQKTIMNNKTKIGLIVTLAGIASNLTAGDFTSYATGDVLICFRSGSGYDLVVDAGPITTFTGYAANSRHTITQFNSTQLSDLGFQTSTFNWSAFTYLANNTLYLTKANNNTAVYTQTTPANDGSSSQQGLAASHMSSIVSGTANFIPGGPAHSGSPYSHSTATAVVEDDSSSGSGNYTSGGVSYHDGIFGSRGSATFGASVSFSPEYTVPAHFVLGGKAVRSDFYQLTPASYGLATMIGYFELSTNGTMTYVAQPTAIPVIQNGTFARNGNVNTFTYDTGLYGTYTLRGTNALGLATSPTNWPAITTLSTGDNNDHTGTDTTTDANRFYSITAQ